MEDAHERLRKSFVQVCDGDPLSQLADDLNVSNDNLSRLAKGNGDLKQIYQSEYMFN